MVSKESPFELIEIEPGYGKEFRVKKGYTNEQAIEWMIGRFKQIGADIGTVTEKQGITIIDVDLSKCKKS